MPRNGKNGKSTKLMECEPLDCFFVTSYTASTVNKILEIYHKVKDKMICHACNANCVDTKLDVKDTYSPTFVILRKRYCLSCWLQKMKLGR
jgi:hypothetical protein